MKTHFRSRIPFGLPGDTPFSVDRLIRVNHAGEYGAKRIYQGQLSVLKRPPISTLLLHMQAQEASHLAYFEQIMIERRVRPTLLFPLWHVMGFALGKATALLGEKAAMACTSAVEEVIDAHYRDQIKSVPKEEALLRENLKRIQLEEQEHHDVAIEEGAEKAPFYQLLRFIIKKGSKTAIFLSERF